MNTTIHYRKRDREDDIKDFYHPECHLLFAEHDGISSLEECPFPLKTDTFEVLLFGKHIYPDRGERDESGDTFAVVRYTKNCGHTVEERIPFCEGVEDFDHCGTKFIGAGYSIRNWEWRIEWFRNQLPCDVCQMVRHAIWIREIGEGERSKDKAVAGLLRLLDYNFSNWRRFIDWDATEKRLRETKYGSR